MPGGVRSNLLISPLDKSIPRNHFDCGNKVLDRFFKNDCIKYSARWEMKTFTCQVQGRERAIGYYSLQLGNESMAEVENKADDYTKNRTAFPAVHLAFIAVHGEWHRKGVGTLMMTDILDRAYAIAQNAGFYALTLQSVDKRSTSFYEKIGFTRYGGSDESPKMLLPARTIVELVESSNS